MVRFEVQHELEKSRGIQNSVSVSEWRAPVDGLALTNDEVHVWRLRLEPPESQVGYLRHLLAPDELSRADSFYFPKDRDHFVVGRGVLRAILGRYLGMNPRDLHFSYSSYGKPSLTRECGGRWLRFNISHSWQLALVAVARGREIGVDIERLRAHATTWDIAEHSFSPGEVAALHAVPPHRQTEAFFNCWTRKEAYIKARGEGLSLPLDKFDVALTPGEPARLLSADGDTHEASRWSIRELNPGDGYVAALAVEGSQWRVLCWEWVW